MHYYHIIASRVKRTASTHDYPAENARLLLASYHAISLGTAPNRLFPVQSKTKNHGIASTLSTFEPLAPRRQHPGSRATINIVHCRNPIVSFFTLNHAHCHHTARARWSGNHMQPLKLLNNAKSRTVSMRLRSPFYLG